MTDLNDLLKKMNSCIKSAYAELSQYQRAGLATPETVSLIATTVFSEYCEMERQEKRYNHELEEMRKAELQRELMLKELSTQRRWWKKVRGSLSL
jgi:hypothetical protein